jgi:hypothetical protein
MIEPGAHYCLACGWRWDHIGESFKRKRTYVDKDIDWKKKEEDEDEEVEEVPKTKVITDGWY